MALRATSAVSLYPLTLHIITVIIIANYPCKLNMMSQAFHKYHLQSCEASQALCHAMHHRHTGRVQYWKDKPLLLHFAKTRPRYNYSVTTAFYIKMNEHQPWSCNLFRVDKQKYDTILWRIVRNMYPWSQYLLYTYRPGRCRFIICI